MLSRAERHRIDRIARGRGEEGLRLLEGPRAVRDALRADAVVELWLRADLAAEVRGELETQAVRRGVRVQEGDRQAFDRLTRTVTPQGVLALVRDTAGSLAVLVERGRRGFLLWLDGVQDPGNVGAVVRVAAGFGATGLLVGDGTADPLGLKALRASTGLGLTLPFARATGLEIAEALAGANVPVWILEAGGDDVLALGPDDVPPGLALVVGAEGAGVGEVARGAAVKRVGIPLAPDVDSLNAAVAAGIAAAHLARVRPAPGRRDA